MLALLTALGCDGGGKGGPKPRSDAGASRDAGGSPARPDGGSSTPGAGACDDAGAAQVPPLGEAEPSDSITYSLVEASGTLTLEASSDDGTCTTSTVAKVELGMPKTPFPEGLSTYLPDAGLLTLIANVSAKRLPRDGQRVCGATMSACPGFADTTQENDIGLSFNLSQPSLPLNAPDDYAFVLFHTLELPRTCDETPYFEGQQTQADSFKIAARRSKPITVAQLKSGRFAVESEGSADVHSAQQGPFDDSAPSPVTGKLTWKYRFVFASASPGPEVPSPAWASEPLADFDACILGDETTEASLDAADAARASGKKSFDVSEHGCTRVELASCGKEVEDVIRVQGTKYVFDTKTRRLVAQPDARVHARIETSPGLVRYQLGQRDDGTFAALQEITFDGSTWKKTVETSRDDTGQPDRRTTLTPKDAQTVHVLAEAYDAGSTKWSVVAEEDSSRAEGACFDKSDLDPADPSGDGTTCTVKYSACTKKQLKRIRSQIGKALKRGSDCLSRDQPDNLESVTAKLDALVNGGKLAFQCSSSPCAPFGELDVAPDANGVYTMYVNSGRNATQNQAFQATLFHELLHSHSDFRHKANKSLEDVLVRAGKLPLYDRTYACEKLCFSDVVSRCDCVTCKSPTDKKPGESAPKKNCDGCSKYGPCKSPKRPELGGSTVASEVGAVCTRETKVCDTMFECTCVSGSCTPFKATCDPNCN